MIGIVEVKMIDKKKLTEQNSLPFPCFFQFVSLQLHPPPKKDQRNLAERHKFNEMTEFQQGLYLISFNILASLFISPPVSTLKPLM